MKTFKSKGTSLRDYLSIIFRYKIIFFVLPAAMIISVFLSMEFVTTEYASSVKMYVKGKMPTEAIYYEEIAMGLPTESHREFLKSGVVLERVVKRLELDRIPLDDEMKYHSRLKRAVMKQKFKRMKQNLAEMPEEQRQKFLFDNAVRKLRGNIAFASPSPKFFSIVVQDFNPNRTGRIANAVSRSYIIFDLEQQIAELKLEYGEKHSTVIKLENYIEEFQKTLDGKPIPDIDAIGPASIKIAQQAKPGMPMEEVRKPVMLMLAFVTGMFLSVILCFVLHSFDLTFRSPQDIEKFLDIPFLGSIPRRKSKDKLLISDVNPDAHDYLQSYQNLCEQALLLIKNNNIQSLLITDYEGSQNNAFVVVNIGTYIAQKTNNKVLIIDADLRRSAVSKIFNISDSNGLNEVIEEKLLFEDAVHEMGSNLYVLSSGKTELDPVTLLGSSIMSHLIKKAEASYDLIIVSSSGIKSFVDAVILSSLTGGCAIVLNEGKIRRPVVEEAIVLLKQKNINIIGAILNDRRYLIPEIIYKLI